MRHDTTVLRHHHHHHNHHRHQRNSLGVVQMGCARSAFSEGKYINPDMAGLPLGDRDFYRLIQSWKGIRREVVETGLNMFLELFRSNSELQAMFKGFKDIKSDSELRSNEALENHATLVMTTLDDAITHIDNFDYVKDLLYRTSVTHTKFTGFQPTYFMHVKEPFLEAVRVTLGDRYTDNMQNIYTIAITYILQTLKDGMEEALK